MKNIERRRTLKVYKLLIAIICMNPFLGSFMPSTLLRIAELLCILYVLYLCYKLNFWARLRTMHISLFLFILAVVGVETVLRGNWSGDIKDIMLKAISKESFLQYFSPFIILSLPNRKYFKDILHLFFYASLLSIPLWLLNMGHLVEKDTSKSYMAEAIGEFLPFFAGFLLSLPQFFTKKQYRLILIVWGIFFLLMLINARRNVSFSFALYAVIAYFFYLQPNKRKNNNNKVLVVFASLIFVGFLVLNFSNLTSGIFKSITKRAGEDTRSGVTEFFFWDYMNAPWEEWAFGRGMDGTYYQPVVDEETGQTKDQREVIETGYLYLMLKGGIVYDVIILLILFTAIRRCFKERHNSAIAYIGVFLCTYLIDLYTTSPLIPYSVRSILFWFCISIPNHYGKEKMFHQNNFQYNILNKK